jgi:hypothetical protein
MRKLSNIMRSIIAAEFLKTYLKENFPQLAEFDDNDLSRVLSSIMADRFAIANVDFPETDVLGGVKIYMDNERISNESTSKNASSEPPSPPQTTKLYVYKDTPFPANVEWPEIVEDNYYLAGLWVGLSWFS